MEEVVTDVVQLELVYELLALKYGLVLVPELFDSLLHQIVLRHLVGAQAARGIVVAAEGYNLAIQELLDPLLTDVADLAELFEEDCRDQSNSSYSD